MSGGTLRIIRRLVAKCALFSIAIGLPIAAKAQDTVSATASDAAEPVRDAQLSKPPLIPTSAFAGRNFLAGAQLSPGGDKIATRVTVNGMLGLVVLDASTRKPISSSAIGDKIELEWFQWAGNDKLLFSVSQPGFFEDEEVRYTRLFVRDLTTNTNTYIGRRQPIVDGDDVIYVADDGAYALVSMQRTIYDYPAVLKFELREGGEMREVQSPRDGVWDWYADSDGVVRIGSGWFNNRLRIYYRSNGERDLDLVGKYREGDNASRSWTVSYVKAGSDIGYVIEENETGRLALRSYDFLNRTTLETIYENPDWDVEEAQIGRDGNPSSVWFTDDRGQIVWLTPEGKRTQRALEQALQEEVVRITSASRDKSKMLVWAGGASDPGALYMFSPKEGRLDQIAEMRNSVPYQDLASPKAFTYEARDGVKIRAYLTLPRGREAKNLPLIILPHGGPFGIRDELRYDDEVQLLANRGYAVLQPNYRGSGGYGDAFGKLGRGQIGRKMQDDLDDAMDWAVAEGIADKNRVCVVGGSYGGYAALWAVTRNPERYRCAASWAGVTDWRSQLGYDRNYLSSSVNRFWRDEVMGEGDKADLDTVSPVRSGASLNRPVLLAHGDEDSRVPFSQFKRMRDATRKAPMPPELLVIEGEGHSFSSAENEQKWYDALEAFLAKHNPAD